MNRYLRHLCLVPALFAFVFGSAALAQAPAAGQTPTTVKLLVVLARYEGEKKLSGFPYTLSLVPGVRGSIRAGAELPVPTTTTVQSDSTAKTITMPSYTMQQVGSQIDATVTALADGKYRLNLSVTDRSVVADTPGARGTVPNVPSFRNMTSNSEAILSSGETIQFTASTDRVTSETFRIDVTLTVGNK